MTGTRIGSLGPRLRQEGGQVLPMTALLMIVLVGFAGLVIDVGRVWIAQRQLQNATDATALAIAQNMPDNYTGWSQVPSFDGVSPSKNALFGYGVSAHTPTVTFSCSPNAPGYDPGSNPPTTATCPQDTSPQDQPSNLCQPGNSLPPAPNGDGSAGCNAVTVSETATVKSTFAAIFNFAHFTLSASSTASAPDQALAPIDVAVVVDTTGSMGQSAPSSSTVCPGINNPTKLDCVKLGLRALLQTLYPCAPGGSCVNQPPLDKVELLVFPGLTSDRAVSAEQSCTALPANAKAYDDPRNRTVNPFTSEGYTFTVVPWENSYATWNQAQGKFVLNAGDPLVSALQTGGNCGLKEGGDTSYTSVLQTAQDSLAALGNDGATHAIVVLGDGEANYGPIYTSPSEPPPSAERHTPCQQAVNVADGATAAGTAIYTVGYWSPPGRPGTVPDEVTQCLGMNGTNACPYRSTNQFNGCTEASLGNPARPWPSVCPSLSGLPNGTNPIRGCWTMYYMASEPANFYPDASDTSLEAIFQQIGQNLGKTRLITSP